MPLLVLLLGMAALAVSCARMTCITYTYDPPASMDTLLQRTGGEIGEIAGCLYPYQVEARPPVGTHYQITGEFEYYLNGGRSIEILKQPTENQFLLARLTGRAARARRQVWIEDDLTTGGLRIKEWLPRSEVRASAGERFVDNLVPLLFKDWSGHLRILYESGEPYAEGELEHGRRAGSWSYFSEDESGWVDSRHFDPIVDPIEAFLP